MLPPITAVLLALVTRQVYLALFAGIFLGTTILAGFNPVLGAAGAIEQLVIVVTNRGNAEVLLFTLVVGGLIVLMRASGGVNGFANFMVSRGWVRGPVSAQLLSVVVGTSIFIESNITCLVTGAVSRPLYDRVKLSRAKLAYMCDSTSAPICILIPINAWGAYVLGLLAGEGLDPLPMLVAAVPLNFYAILAIVVVITVAVTGWNIGPMRRAEEKALAGNTGALPEQSIKQEHGGSDGTKDIDPPERAVNLIAPVIVTVATMFLGLWVTGGRALEGIVPPGGEPYGLLQIIMKGSGSLSVLWAVSAGVATAIILARVQGIFTFTQAAELVVVGFRELIGVATILALALAIGQVCRALGTGPWVADMVSPWLNAVSAAPLIFATSGFIAFATGTSWGTWAIMFPIGIALAGQLEASIPLTVGAILGGGIFGDHCSPISDTTVISSMSAGVDHIEHVVTQVPYALVGGVIATALYFAAGLLL